MNNTRTTIRREIQDSVPAVIVKLPDNERDWFKMNYEDIRIEQGERIFRDLGNLIKYAKVEKFQEEIKKFCKSNNILRATLPATKWYAEEGLVYHSKYDNMLKVTAIDSTMLKYAITKSEWLYRHDIWLSKNVNKATESFKPEAK